MPFNKIAGIYKITCIPNGRVYVGCSMNIGERITHHKTLLKNGNHVNPKLLNSYQKHGKDSFVWELLEEIHNPTMEKLFEREAFWFTQTNCFDKDLGFNICTTPNCGPIMKGENHPFFGVRGAEHPAFGTRRTEEECQECSKISSEMWTRPEHREKMSKIQKENAKSDWFKEWRAKGNAARRIVDKLPTEKIFELYDNGMLIKDIASRYDVCYPTISKILATREKPSQYRARETITDKLRQEIKSLLLEGVPVKEIPKLTGVSESSVKVTKRMIRDGQI